MKGSIRKRGEGSFELTVDYGREGGKRIRAFETVKGKRADADRRMRELLSAADKGETPHEKTTVAEMAERWLKRYVATKEQRTFERYRGLLRSYIIPAFGSRLLAKVKVVEVADFEAELTLKGLSVKTIETIHVVFSGMYKYAIAQEVVTRNPVRGVPLVKAKQPEITPPALADVRRMLEIAEAQADPFYPMLTLIAHTGIRRGEALGLRHRDCNLEAGTITITQTVQRSADLGVIITENPKTKASRRTIDLDPGTIEVLRAHAGAQLLHRMRLEDAWCDNDLVFPDALGRPMNPMAATRAFKRLAAAAGMRDARLHDLRHLHITVLLQQGENPVVVSKRAGHKTVSITLDIYGHVMPGRQKELAVKFARALEDG